MYFHLAISHRNFSLPGRLFMKLTINLAVLLLSLILIFGCSGSQNPTEPGNPDSQLLQNSATEYTNSRSLLGIWNVRIDPDTLQADITPLRSAEFTANITRLMQPPAKPMNMVSLQVLAGTDIPNGYVHFAMGLTHPFAGYPIFRAFDTRGIILSNGTHTTAHDPSLIFAGDEETHLNNADGYTRWWNSVEFTSYGTVYGFNQGAYAPPTYPSATLNGYKYFANGFTEDADLADLDISTRGTFEPSTVVKRDYELQFKMNGGQIVFDFNYAIDVSWSLPDQSYAPDYPVEAYDLLANSQEAYWVGADFSDSTAWWSSPTTYGGDLHINLEVGDWGALADDSTVADQVSAIWVESPELGIDPVDVMPIATASNGNGATTSVFSFDLMNVSPSDLENQKLLVSVESSNPSNYAPMIPNPDAFAWPDKPLAAYMFFDVPILDTPPVLTPSVHAIDPTSAEIDTGDIPVVVSGSNFEPDAYVELIKNDDPLVVIEASGESVGPGGILIDCAVNVDSLNGAELGTYDVKVTNPGPPSLSGQLDDGFEIVFVPISTCDEIYDTHLYEGSFAQYATGMTQIDTAFTRDGLLLMKSYDGGGAYGLYGYDVAQNGAVSGVPVISGMVDGMDGIGSLDVDDLTGNIIYVCPLDQNNVIAYTEGGTLIGTFQNENTTAVYCVETDFDGALWICGLDEPGGGKVIMNHYTWDGSNYIYDPAGSVEITGDLSLLGPFDMAVSYHDRKLLLFGQGEYQYKGQLVCYDVSSGIPAKEYTLDQFLPTMIGSHAYGYFRASCDIEIDHTVPELEHCRVAIMERCQPWQEGTAFLKMDVDGTILDTYQFPDGYSTRQFFTISIYPIAGDPDGTFLACQRDASYDGNQWEYDVYATPEGW
jgi:hypothetical protein